MVVILPIFTSGWETEWFQPCVSSVELGATERRRTLASFIVELEILLFLFPKFIYFVLKMAWTNGRHSINFHFWVAKRVVPALYYYRRACRNRKQFVNILPSLSNWRFCWFCFLSWFILLLKMAWMNGRHSTKKDIWCDQGAVPSVYWSNRACRNRKQEDPRLFHCRIQDFLVF